MIGYDPTDDPVQRLSWTEWFVVFEDQERAPKAQEENWGVSEQRARHRQQVVSDLYGPTHLEKRDVLAVVTRDERERAE